MDALSAEISEAVGVGPERAAQLAKLGVRTVRDLLWLRPRRHEDRRQLGSIGDLAMERPGAALGRVVVLGVKRFSKGGKSLFELVLEDATGRLHCRWWNLPYMRNYFEVGDRVLAFGRLNSMLPRTMDHPETEVLEGEEEASIHLDRLAPVYPLTEGLPQRWLRTLVWRVLEKWGGEIQDPWADRAPEGFLERGEAVRRLHFPNEPGEAERARQRLALDELIGLQLKIQSRRKKLLANARRRPCGGDNRLVKPFLGQLGFSLTRSQTSVLREMRRELREGWPMRRLLQGDVGSGKTVVAACCALMVMESGFNAAFMAPTEILAEQHYRTFSRWFSGLGLEVHLHTGGTKTLDGNGKTGDTAAGGSDGGEGGGALGGGRLVVGTHALVQDSFSLEKLGLVVIDEQHKFGVAQRETFLRKGDYPHLLVMTATPIPRTLALTVYGDLDASILAERPAGRALVRTHVRKTEALPKVWEFLKRQMGEGRQAFVIFPRIEEGGKQGLKAALKEWEGLSKVFEPFRAGLLHGQMASEEKEAVMREFRENQVQVLISTPIVEVGVDVANATIMVIENADQFGLAQLHQLRGRIGRGSHESHCILISDKPSAEGEQRLRTLAGTTDGFEVAEADLRIRGPGDLLGQEQSGLPPLVFADLARDGDLVEAARGVAGEILKAGVEAGQLE